jgi:hypothetical protein
VYIFEQRGTNLNKLESEVNGNEQRRTEVKFNMSFTSTI